MNKFENENILLMGDFNARTGNKDDIILGDENIFDMFVNDECMQKT